MASIASSSPPPVVSSPTTTPSTVETLFECDEEKLQQEKHMKLLIKYINFIDTNPGHENIKKNLNDDMQRFYLNYVTASRIGVRHHFKEEIPGHKRKFGTNLHSIENAEQINNMNIPDLRCWYCLAHLNKPTTHGTGMTVCLACVEKYNGLVDSKNAFATAFDVLNFGKNINVTLSSISKKCMQKSHLAAEKRAKGNNCFREKNYQEAIDLYTEALEDCPEDIVLYSNRAAAYISKDLIEVEATNDLHSAIYLLKAQHIGFAYPMYRKIFNRLISVLEKKVRNIINNNNNKKKEEKNNKLNLSMEIKRFEIEILLLQAYIIGNGMLRSCETPQNNPNWMENPLAQRYVKKGTALFKKTISYAMKKCGKDKTLNMFSALFISLNKVEFLKNVEKEGYEMNRAKNIDIKHKISKSELENIKEDLECPLCMNIFYRPTTLPCGHVLCHPCLARTLDHAFQKPVNCPLCRSSLNEYLRFLNSQAQFHTRQLRSTNNDNEEKKLIHGSAMIPVDKTLHSLLLNNFPEEYKARELLAKKEEAPSSPVTDRATVKTPTTTNDNNADVDDNNNTSNDDKDHKFGEIPIFICGLAYPGISFPLHVFEPRYRLMMRRCIEDGSRVFGMVMHTGNGSGSEFGTLVRIEDFQQLSDGRSRVDTIGTRRFKVLQYGEKDGYATGKVEYIEDNIELSTDEIAEISSIANQVKAIVQQSGHGRHIYMQLGVIPSVDVNPTFPLNWFLIASDIFGIQLSQTTKYDFLFGDACRESKKKRLEKFKELFRMTPLFNRT